MALKRTSLAIAVGMLLGTGAMSIGEAQAWHHGTPHVSHGGHDEIIVERRHRGGGGGGYVNEGHHRPHHRHCREIEYHDHHGRHRVRTVCH